MTNVIVECDLTQEELTLLQNAADGKTYIDTARELNRSLGSLKVNVAKPLFDKLQAPCLINAVVKAMRCGWIE